MGFGLEPRPPFNPPKRKGISCLEEGLVIVCKFISYLVLNDWNKYSWNSSCIPPCSCRCSLPDHLPVEISLTTLFLNSHSSCSCMYLFSTQWLEQMLMNSSCIPPFILFPVHAHLKAKGFLQSDLSGLALCVLTYSLPRMECINDVATHLSIMLQ